MDNRTKSIDDSPKVEYLDITTYALFMGYLSMAVRGMGFLVVLWTTVVLLGGFVSDLVKKDFWCLTIITLLQTAGAFNAFSNEKLRYSLISYDGLVMAIFANLLKKKTKVHDGASRRPSENEYSDDDDDYQYTMKSASMAFALLIVAKLVSTVILYPLLALYMGGLVITTGLSVWRLVQRDYGENADSNLPLALNVLYSLALVQGVLFFFRFALRYAAKRLLDMMADGYGMDESTRPLLDNYMLQMRHGCGKDPSFVNWANPVTYAVWLMDPTSSLSLSIWDGTCWDFPSGARILDAVLEKKPEPFRLHALTKELVCSPTSPTTVFQKLLQALEFTSTVDAETRQCAARIVAHLADGLRLDQFPWAVHSIASLLESPKKNDDDDGGEYKEGLAVQGLAILERLAADEHNCRAISETQNLLSKIMAPVSSDILHRIDHDASHIVVEGSLKVMFQLVVAPGETSIKFRAAIASSKKAVESMHKILSCDDCRDQIPTGAILASKILTKLSPDDDALSNDDDRQQFTNLLVKIFTDGSKDLSIIKLAGEELAKQSEQSKSSATRIFKASDDVVDDLTDMVSRMIDDTMDDTCGICAAQILEHLFNYYDSIDDDCRNKLRKAFTDIMPKLLGKIVSFGLGRTQKQREETQKGKSKGKFSADIEKGQAGSDSQDNAQINNSSYSEPEGKQPVNGKVQVAMLSLGEVIFDKIVSEQQDDVDKLLDTISPGDSVLSFARKLKHMVERNSEEPKASCLRVLKFTAKMVISVMRVMGHKNSYTEEELESLGTLITVTLSDASKKMLGLEGILFAISDLGAANGKPETLLSLVEEAQDLLKMYTQYTNHHS